MRPMDRIGIVGVVLVAFGAAMTMVAESALPLWVRWLIGPLFWYGGFAFILAWALLRAFPATPMTRGDAEEQALEEMPQANVAFLRSNFLEHGHDNVA